MIDADDFEDYVDPDIDASALPIVTPPPFVPGLYDDMPASVYHAVEAVSSSGVAKLLQSPAHYRFVRDHPNPPTPQMEFGTVVHCGVLEPMRFDSLVACAPAVNKRTKAGRGEWQAFVADNAGRIVLSRPDYERAGRCIDAVNAHPAARRLLEGAIRERSLFWTDAQYDVPCKARFDAWNNGILVDVKTTADASKAAFAASIATYGYDTQAAFYVSGAEHVLNETPSAYAIVCVESEPPHAVACYELGHASILAGRALADMALERYAQALRAGRWSGYPETIDRIESPAWRRRIVH